MTVSVRPSRSDFYPRPPRGGRPIFIICTPLQDFISIHALREEGDLIEPEAGEKKQEISIHALREEGDAGRPRRALPGQKISIHALREEGDRPTTPAAVGRKSFLSTPSARRATWPPLKSTLSHGDFYPRPPRGGRRAPLLTPRDSSRISIHALREEGDPDYRLQDNDYSKFLSTPSARRATDALFLLQDGVGISIHALREEGDRWRSPA